MVSWSLMGVDLVPNCFETGIWFIGIWYYMLGDFGMILGWELFNTSHIPQMIKSGTFNTIHQLNREVNCHYWKGWDFMFQHLFGWFLFRNPRNGTISRPVESLNMQSLVTQLEEVDHCCWGDESWPRLCPFGNNRGAGSWLIPSIIIETCC